MTRPISAPVRRILKGHSDRALIHAVDDNGLEYKVEVPLAAVHEVDPEQRYVLVFSWSLQSAPTEAGTPEVASSPSPSSRAASSSATTVDQAFMALMTRQSERASPEQIDTSTQKAAQGLAELLGSIPAARRSQ